MFMVLRGRFNGAKHVSSPQSRGNTCDTLIGQCSKTFKYKITFINFASLCISSNCLLFYQSATNPIVVRIINAHAK